MLNNIIEIKIGICNQKSNPIRIEPTKVAAAKLPKVHPLL